MNPKPLFTNREYKQAKQFLKDAIRLSGGYSSPSYSRKMFEKSGRVFMECESHLESPLDDYAVFEISDSKC